MPFIAPRFENQADWFACRHMATLLQENKQMSFAAPPVPRPEVEDTVGLDAYRAGHYPHAVSLSPAVPPLAAAALPATAPSAVPTAVPPAMPHFVTSPRTPLQAGAEVFISALDAVVETSHRDRDRRGWMHPSVSSRLKLVRDMAAYPMLAEQFNRRMVRLRLIIAAYFIVGIASGASHRGSHGFKSSRRHDSEFPRPKIALHPPPFIPSPFSPLP